MGDQAGDSRHWEQIQAGPVSPLDRTEISKAAAWALGLKLGGRAAHLTLLLPRATETRGGLEAMGGVGAQTASQGTGLSPSCVCTPNVGDPPSTWDLACARGACGDTQPSAARLSPSSQRFVI